MREFDFPLKATEVIGHPPCPNCRTPMWLASIEPADVPDYDRRTFECPRCQHSIHITIESGNNGRAQHHPAFLARAVERAAFLAGARVSGARLADGPPSFRLRFSASIKLMTLADPCGAAAGRTAMPFCFLLR